MLNRKTRMKILFPQEPLFPRRRPRRSRHHCRHLPAWRRRGRDDSRSGRGNRQLRLLRLWPFRLRLRLPGADGRIRRGGEGDPSGAGRGRAEGAARFLRADERPGGKVWVFLIALLVYLGRKLFCHFRYPSLKFTSPVLYDPSPYPKSDALKVVSDAGSRLSLAPGAAALFFASPELLPHVVDTVLSVGGGRASSRSSPVAAPNRRWFVRGIAGTQVQTSGYFLGTQLHFVFFSRPREPCWRTKSTAGSWVRPR